MTKTLAKIGITAALVAMAPLALAQTTTDTTTGTTSGTSTPGTPNTGAGGDAATNAIVLTLAGVAALGGIAYLARTRQTA